MFKILIALGILSGSFASYAQNGMNESPMNNRMEESFPSSKTSVYSESRVSAGITSGVNSPKGDLTSSTEFGLIVGMVPTTHFGAAIEGNTTRLNKDNDLRQTTVLFRPTYVIGGDVPVLRSSFLGVGLGPVFLPNSKVRWAGAPLVGFDIPLSSKKSDYLSLGLEAKYLFVTNTDIPDLFSSAVAVKYWF